MKKVIALCLLMAFYARGQFKSPPKLLDAKHSRIVPDEVITGKTSRSLLSWKTPPSAKYSTLEFQGGTLLANPANGTVLWLKGENLARGISVVPEDKNTMVFATYAYATRNKALLKLRNPQNELQLEKIQEDNFGKTHIRMHQYFQGIKVWASQIFFHYDAEGKLYCVNGNYHPTPNLQKIKYNVAVTEARQKTLQHVSTITTYKELSPWEQKVLEYSEPITEKVIYPYQGKFYVAWHVTVRPNFLERYEYFIDAVTGEVIDYYKNTTHGDVTTTATDLLGQSRTIHTYQQGNTYYMIDASRPMFDATTASFIPNLDKVKGVLVTLIAQNGNKDIYHITSTNNSWTDARSVSSHYNAATCYEYYRTTFNRNAIDGQGGNIISIINVMDPQTGQQMDNAFWNGKFMAYGNGNQLFSKPLAAALDVAGHEMTHGVIEKTANLIYRDQSGALNESIADFFGCMIERNNWLIGEDVANGAIFPSGAMRDMSNPHNGGNQGDPGWQPAHMNEFVNTTQDNGGVHINSGIHNKALYLLAAAITKTKAEQIVYKALTTYLTRSSNFIDARNAMIQAATDIYGANSNETAQVKAAYDAVGITTGQGGGGGNDIPGIIGTEWILAHAVTGDPNSLYLVDAGALLQGSNNAITAISQTQAYRPPYVSDDGSVATFVNKQTNQIHIINMDATNPNEQYFPNFGNYWQNAVISPDGKRIIMTSIYNDTSLYLLDMPSSTLYKFKLYQPTYAQGQQMEAQIIPDMLYWHPNGEYVFFDKQISISGGTQPISFWDIGIIKVWNKQNNSVGDGSIINLYANLPTGVSIGNPALATNSPHIITFDYYDANTGQIAVLAVNTETGQGNTIFTNSTLGFPDYSNDDKYIIFTTLNTNGDTVSARIPVNTDKITPAGQAQGLLTGARWSKWFAKGQRFVNVELLEQKVEAFLFPNPTAEEPALKISLKAPSKVSYQIFSITGKEVGKKTFKRISPGTVIRLEEVRELTPGMYFLRLQTKEGNALLQFIKK